MRPSRSLVRAFGGLTGATVLAIVREGSEVVVPSGREALQAGDLLAVAGTEGALAAARALLAGGTTEAE